MTSDRENREWLNDYMSLKQVNENNPFTVPDGYFDDLEQHIMSSVKLEELKKSDPLAQGFSVPENYFDELSSNINSRIKIEEALNEKEAGFAVPEGYFEELAANIQARINVEEVLNKETTGFAIPEGYFEDLQQQIQSRVFVEESLGHEADSFSVPHEYFNQLTENILNKTTRQETVKKKGVVRQLFSSTVIKYATAACVTLAVGGTILLTRNNSSTTNTANLHTQSFLHKSLAAIPIDDIQNYLKMNSDANDDARTAIDDSKVNADNLNNDLQDELDTTSQ